MDAEAVAEVARGAQAAARTAVDASRSAHAAAPVTSDVGPWATKPPRRSSTKTTTAVQTPCSLWTEHFAGLSPCNVDRPTTHFVMVGGQTQAAPAAAQLQTAPTSGGTRTPKGKAKAKGKAACDNGKKRATDPGTAVTEMDQAALKLRKKEMDSLFVKAKVAKTRMLAAQRGYADIMSGNQSSKLFEAMKDLEELKTNMWWRGYVLQPDAIAWLKKNHRVQQCIDELRLLPRLELLASTLEAEMRRVCKMHEASQG